MSFLAPQLQRVESVNVRRGFKWQPAFKKMHEKRWFFRVPCNYSRMQLCSSFRV